LEFVHVRSSSGYNLPRPTDPDDRQRRTRWFPLCRSRLPLFLYGLETRPNFLVCLRWYMQWFFYALALEHTLKQPDQCPAVGRPKPKLKLTRRGLDKGTLL